MKKVIKTKGEARQYAIDWGLWQREQDLSYGELAVWEEYFIKLAKKFNEALEVCKLLSSAYDEAEELVDDGSDIIEEAGLLANDIMRKIKE